MGVCFCIGGDNCCIKRNREEWAKTNFGHCCMCQKICHHVGGPWYCAQHTQSQICPRRCGSTPCWSIDHWFGAVEDSNYRFPNNNGGIY